MSRPKVTLENQQAVYEFYEQYEPSARAQQAAHRILSMAFRPQGAFAHGVEDELEQAAENDTRLIIVANHVRKQDPVLFGPALRLTPALRHYNGRTFEPAKPILFQYPVLRPTIDVLGAVPVFRDKDVNNQESTKAFLNLAAKKIVRGRSMIIHPEGTRNTGDPRQLQAIKGGTGRVACMASADADVAILPIGIWYRPEMEHGQARKPNMYFGNLLHGPFERRHDVTAWIAENLQDCLDHAIEMG